MQIIAAPLLIPFLIVAAVFLSGRGAWMIAGYNLKTAEEKAKYNEKALCRFMGLLLLFVCAHMILMSIADLFGLAWLITPATILFLIILLGGVVYANTSKRFHKK